MKKRFLTILLIGGACMFACKPKDCPTPKPLPADTTQTAATDTTKPAPTPTPAPQPTPQPVVKAPKKVVEIRNLRLYDKDLDTATNPAKYKFFDVSKKVSSNLLTSHIDIAYINSNDQYDTYKHAIGSSSASAIKDKHALPNTITASNAEFYSINSSSGSLLFDTITLSASIATIFASNATLSAPNPHIIYSNTSGWEAGDIIGFKSNDIKGLIHITATPTNSITTDGITTAGRIQFDIKMENSDN